MGRYNNGKSVRGGTNNKSMSILTVNLSDDLLDMLALGKGRGWWASRSEGIRVGLGRGLPLLIAEKEEMIALVLKELKVEGKLDIDKDYVRIPGRGYIEIIGEA